MNISSRTPEGLPSRCALCGAGVNLEVSEPAGDAPCPACGHLLWYSSDLLDKLRSRMADTLGVAPEQISADTPWGTLGADSLDTVELIMELEEDFDVTIPDEDAERLQSLADVIRYLQRRRRPPEA
jgi:acyl carrier protein